MLQSGHTSINSLIKFFCESLCRRLRAPRAIQAPSLAAIIDIYLFLIDWADTVPSIYLSMVY